jgi:hypothetical protein
MAKKTQRADRQGFFSLFKKLISVRAENTQKMLILNF